MIYKKECPQCGGQVAKLRNRQDEDGVLIEDYVCASCGNEWVHKPIR